MLVMWQALTLVLRTTPPWIEKEGLLSLRETHSLKEETRQTLKKINCDDCDEEKKQGNAQNGDWQGKELLYVG